MTTTMMMMMVVVVIMMVLVVTIFSSVIKHDDNHGMDGNDSRCRQSCLTSSRPLPTVPLSFQMRR